MTKSIAIETKPATSTKAKIKRVVKSRVSKAKAAASQAKTFTTRDVAAELGMTPKNARGKIRRNEKSIDAGMRADGDRHTFYAKHHAFIVALLTPKS